MNAGNSTRYVSMNPRFSLRGWLDEPYAVLDGLTATIHPVSKGLFNTLQMCNGRFRVNDTVFFGIRQKLVEQLGREGVLSFHDEPTSLDPAQEYRYYPNNYIAQF